MKKELLVKFLNNQCTAEELGVVISWLQTEAHKEPGKSLGISVKPSDDTAKEEIDPERLRSILDKIHHTINIEDQKQSLRLKTGTLKLVLTWLTRAAAVLLLPVLALLYYTLSESRRDQGLYLSNAPDSLEIVAPIGSRTVFDLADGTKIHLNYGSSLKYPQRFTGNTREVVLKGEGFFEVAADARKPFIVRTGSLNIKALGTRFNVQAYPGDAFIATTLVEGKVVIERPVGNETKQVGEMVPSQHLNYQINSQKFSSFKGNVGRYIAWKDGKLVFHNESVTEVARRLSRMFNLEIEVAEEVRDFTYTVTFVDEPLTQILDLMAIATPVTYKMLPRTKLPDGTFSKQKIIIEKRK